MKVLLIDDDEDTTFLMDVLFRKSQIIDSYIIKNNGNKALEYLLSHSMDPDCIFVDLKMPDMNGFEFIEKYEELFSQRLATTQVYFLSNSAMVSDHEKAKSYHSVKEFIPKPLNISKLKTINQRIKNYSLGQ